MVPPAGPKSAALFLGGSHLAVFKSSANPVLAKALVRYLATDKAAQLAYAEASGFMPALKAALDDSVYLSDSKRAVFRKIAERGRAYPGVPYWAEIETSILMKRLGNLFDIAAEVSGPYSEAAVRAEVAAAVHDIDGVIREHAEGKK
jgi:multiple sugar transport system substrate-binding protein